MSDLNSITVSVRVRPLTVRETDSIPAESAEQNFQCLSDFLPPLSLLPFISADENSAASGSLTFSSNPAKSASSTRRIIQVIDTRILVFDPPESNNVRAFQSMGRIGSKPFKDQRYAFDQVFNEDAQQEEVFERTTKPLLDGILNGYNATVFAYGATGCGKTHTISGTEESPGIIFLTMRELFQRISECGDEKKVELSLCYLEIYNECIQDLLTDDHSKAAKGGLALREDANNKIVIPGLTEHHPTSPEEVNELILAGNRRRTMSPTMANATSSRSHAVLQINVKQTERSSDESSIATLSIIDLAGSERASATQNSGARLHEGANINKSLLALGNCINALCEGGRGHIPYRNSKLTRLLKFSLGGNCKTCMIVCVSPCSVHYEETHNTLKYANRAKNIKTKISRNTVNADSHVRAYVATIAELRAHNAQLKAQLDGSQQEESLAQKRKRSNMLAEVERSLKDLRNKSEANKDALAEAATCEATILAASTRLAAIQPRLNALKGMPEGLQSDLQSELDLLTELCSADRFVTDPNSGVKTRLMVSQRSISMFDAALQMAADRRYEGVDEEGARAIKDAVRLETLQSKLIKSEARERILVDYLTSSGFKLSQIVGIGARCTVSMKEASNVLRSKGDDALLLIADRLASMSEQNDSIFKNIIGSTTLRPPETDSFDPSIYAPTNRSKPSALPFKSVPEPRSRLSAFSNPRLESLRESPSKPKMRSPRKGSSALRPSAIQPGVLYHRASEFPSASKVKKSFRWKDEAGEGSLCARKSLESKSDVSDRQPSGDEWEDDVVDKMLFLPSTATPTKAMPPVRMQLPSSAVRAPLLPLSRSKLISKPLPLRRPPVRQNDSILNNLQNLPEEDDNEEAMNTSLSSKISRPSNELPLRRPPFTEVSNSLSSRPPATRPFLMTTGSARSVSASNYSNSQPVSAERRMSSIGPVRSERKHPRSSLVPFTSKLDSPTQKPNIVVSEVMDLVRPQRSPKKPLRRASLAGVAPSLANRRTSLALRPLRMNYDAEKSFDNSVMAGGPARAIWK